MPELTQPKQLTPQQEAAIDLILVGENDSKIAEVIGKSRSTVNIWRNHEPLFIATLNERRQQIRSRHLNRLNDLVPQALNVIEGGLQDSDIKVCILSAVHILKAAGVYGATVPGSQKTDPAEIAADHEIKEKARKNRLDMDKDPSTRQAYWEQLLTAYAEIPQEALDTLDDRGLRQLVLDLVEARDNYLKTLKDDLIPTVNSEPQIWEDCTEDIRYQVEAEVQLAKENTDVVLRVFLNTWEKRGGDAAQLLEQSKQKRKGQKKNLMMLPNGSKIPLGSDPQPLALPKPSETKT